MAGPERPQPSALGHPVVTFTEARVSALYANVCRVSCTPEEMIFDFGLNPEPLSTQKVEISQRVILNHFTAKRLLGALSVALERHEQAFGVLETDVRKRTRGPSPWMAVENR